MLDFEIINIHVYTYAIHANVLIFVKTNIGTIISCIVPWDIKYVDLFL